MFFLCRNRAAMTLKIPSAFQMSWEKEVQIWELKLTVFFINNQLFSVLKYPLKKVNMSTLLSCRDDLILVKVLPHPEKTRSGSTLLSGIEFKFS
jgi:hypothetical protein